MMKNLRSFSFSLSLFDFSFNALEIIHNSRNETLSAFQEQQQQIKQQLIISLDRVWTKEKSTNGTLSIYIHEEQQNEIRKYQEKHFNHIIPAVVYPNKIIIKIIIKRNEKLHLFLYKTRDSNIIRM